MHQSDDVRSQLKLHFVVFLWGFTAILGDLISLDAIPLVAHRMFIAVVAIYIFLKYKKTSTAVKGAMRYKLYAAGGVIALHWITFFHAIKISNVSITLACMGSAALFVSILEPIFFKRKVAWSEILLGVAVIIGVSTIFWSENDYATGIIVALISAFLSASFSVINGLLVKKESSAVITVHELFGGWALVALFLTATILFSDRTVESIVPTLPDVGYLMLLGILATAYAFIQSVEVMRHLSPFTVVLTINLEPVYGILAAYLILGDEEKMSKEFYFGTLIILAAVVTNGWLKRKRKRKLAQQQ
ncbi:DMT family transporter [Phaeocystidibacter luteus]|uniref:EamA family transporter n=1 Tax=Phaeocystidibacter luteus TaxID=911197 RepID=A0A6N6RF28_9FLAO|nr:DMT family transporter [Phaeocystidibacter luteus]KAB2806764.1 EamA family transporter [Phaeocystidibacter luteus]